MIQKFVLLAMTEIDSLIPAETNWEQQYRHGRAVPLVGYVGVSM